MPCRRGVDRRVIIERVVGARRQGLGEEDRARAREESIVGPEGRGRVGLLMGRGRERSRAHEELLRRVLLERFAKVRLQLLTPSHEVRPLRLAEKILGWRERRVKVGGSDRGGIRGRASVIGEWCCDHHRRRRELVERVLDVGSGPFAV